MPHITIPDITIPEYLWKFILGTAMALYRAMGMTFWLPRAEAVLVEVRADGRGPGAGCAGYGGSS